MTRVHRHDSTPRVVLLTSPGLFGAEIINRLASAEGIQLAGVGLTGRLYKGKGLFASVHTFRVRTGWRYLLYNALQSNVAWSWLRLTGRPTGLKQVSGQVRVLHDVNAAETLDWLRSLQPDYVASFFFNQWIGADVRCIPTRGAVNLHPSLLPDLRGPDPIFRTLERGLQTSGFTIHDIADRFDEGQILYQERCEVPPGLTAFGLYLKMVRQGADLLGNWLGGKATPAPHFAQAASAGDYTTFPTPAEVGQFVGAGHRLIQLGEWHRALSSVR